MRNAVVLGCPRSGTSIMGELFEVLPCYGYEFEPDVEWLRGRRFDIRPWAMKNPVTFRLTEDEAIEVRTPGLACNLDELLEVVPDPVLIWIVRHPLDAIASMQPGMAEGWGHGPRPPDWRDYEGPIRRAARMWSWVNGPGYDAVADRVMLVRYEDLVAAPAHVALDVINAVEAPTLQIVLRQYAAMVVDEPVLHARHQHRWSRPGHDLRVGSWPSRLSGPQVETALTMLGDLPARFGYLED